MQLKSNDEPNVNEPQNTQASTFVNQSYYENSGSSQAPNQGTPYGSPMGSSQDPRSQGRPYGSLGTPNQGGPGMPNQGRPGMPNQGRPGSPYGSDEPIIKSKSGINPLFIIVPILLLLIIVGVTQFKKVFGKSEYIPGTVTDSTYKNEYFNVKCELGSGWEINPYTGSAEEEKKALNAKNSIHEINATKTLSNEMIDFMITQTPYNVKETGTDIEKLIESFKADYEKELAANGYTVTSIRQDKMTVAGKTSDGLFIDCEYLGQKVSFVQFFVFKGNYVMIVSAASTSEGKAKLIITNNVSALE